MRTDTKIEQEIPLGTTVKGTRKTWPYEGWVTNYEPWDGMYSVVRQDGRSWTDTAEYLEVKPANPDVEAMTEVEIRSEQKKIGRMIQDQLREIDEAQHQLDVLTSYKDELDAELKKIYAQGEGELQ